MLRHNGGLVLFDTRKASEPMIMLPLMRDTRSDDVGTIERGTISRRRGGGGKQSTQMAGIKRSQTRHAAISRFTIEICC